MKPESRLELLKAITELCERYPHWRFGQLISNVAGWADGDLGDVEDDQLLESAKAHLDHLAKREEVQT